MSYLYVYTVQLGFLSVQMFCHSAVVTFHLLINNLFQIFQFDETKTVGELIMEIKRITDCPAKLSFASVQKDPISPSEILKNLNLPSSNYLKLKCIDKSCTFSVQQQPEPTPSVIEVNKFEKVLYYWKTIFV
jgi:hypothetical protein